MITHLPYPIGSVVSEGENRQAIVNKIIVRDNDYAYSLTHFHYAQSGEMVFHGKSAWHEHTSLSFVQDATLETMNFLRVKGDL